MSATKVNQPTGKPTAKVATATIGGAVVTVVAFVFSLTGLDVDPAVSAAVATIVVFLVGYFKRDTAPPTRTVPVSEQPAAEPPPTPPSA